MNFKKGEQMKPLFLKNFKSWLIFLGLVLAGVGFYFYKVDNGLSHTTTRETALSDQPEMQTRKPANVYSAVAIGSQRIVSKVQRNFRTDKPRTVKDIFLDNFKNLRHTKEFIGKDITGLNFSGQNLKGMDRVV